MVETSESAVNAFKEAQHKLNFETLGISKDIADKIGNISFSDYDKALHMCKAELKRLKIRFSRDKINISFVGRAGQGKKSGTSEDEWTRWNSNPFCSWI